MIEISIFTWLIAVFGLLVFLPLMVAQFILLIKPQGQAAKNLLIGKGGKWRDKTHFKYSLAFAWADWLVIFPLLIFGNIGVFVGELWGYVLWLALGSVSIYFSIVFWVLEKEYSLPSVGRLAYYTYFWGFFLYWGIAAVVISLIQLI